MSKLSWSDIVIVIDGSKLHGEIGRIEEIIDGGFEYVVQFKPEIGRFRLNWHEIERL